MLNPNKDRLNYGNILYPPFKHKLDFAIGTSYSLDLYALACSTLSLSLSQQIDSSIKDNPICLLEILRKTADKISLFCEKGKIQYSSNPNQLYILLEDMVFEVDNPKNKYSFHPKFWLLRFIDEKDNVKYRLIVLSRNLTFDKSWDVSFTMEGHKTNKKTSKNDAISEFINYLIRQAIDENADKNSTVDKKTEKMREILEELKYIKFELESEIFDDFEFIVNGIDNDGYSIQNYPLFKENWDELFIMSPFLNENEIKKFDSRKNSNSKAMLITREASLRGFDPKFFNDFDVYVLKDEITGVESLTSEEFQIPNQDIHAKIYFMERGNDCELYLGSLNASNSALNGNVECMIKLNTNKNKFNIKNLIEDIFNGEIENPNSPFRHVSEVEDVGTSDPIEKLDLIFKKILRLNFTSKATLNDDMYNLEVNVDDYDENQFQGCKIEIKPLLGNFKALSKHLKFELPKSKLSKFFVLRVSHDNVNIKRIIKIQIDGMLEDRQNDIILSLIKEPAAFISYVSLLMYENEIFDYASEGSSSKIREDIKRITTQPVDLYEKMLKTAYYNPDIIRNLEILFNIYIAMYHFQRNTG